MGRSRLNPCRRRVLDVTGGHVSGAVRAKLGSDRSSRSDKAAGHSNQDSMVMTISENPSVAVVGPGAIGTTLAAALHEAGRTPTVCGRTAHERLELPFMTPRPTSVRPSSPTDKVDALSNGTVGMGSCSDAVDSTASPRRSVIWSCRFWRPRATDRAKKRRLQPATRRDDTGPLPTAGGRSALAAGCSALAAR